MNATTDSGTALHDGDVGSVLQAHGLLADEGVDTGRSAGVVSPPTGLKQRGGTRVKVSARRHWEKTPGDTASRVLQTGREKRQCFGPFRVLSLKHRRL